MRSATTKRKGASQPAKREDWGQLGPAMRGLPNDQWRAFALARATDTGPVHGRYVRAARAAGFAKDSTPANLGKLAWQLAHDERMIAAVAEESRKHLRSAHPEAVSNLLAIACDATHKDQMRAISEILSRTDPAVTKQDISVTHKIVDPDREALEELRALREIGATREKLIELFGGNGLARLERLEAADIARRAAEAKVIEGELIDG